MDKEIVYAGVLDVIRKVRRESGAEEDLPGIKETDHLYEIGVVDSLTMVEIIFYIEEITGKPVDFQSVNPESFFRLSQIYDYVSTVRESAILNRM